MGYKTVTTWTPGPDPDIDSIVASKIADLAARGITATLEILSTNDTCSGSRTWPTQEAAQEYADFCLGAGALTVTVTPE